VNAAKLGPSYPGCGGDVLSFRSPSFTPFVPNDTNGVKDVFLKDRQTGEVTVISTDSNGNLGNADSSYARISRDGKYVSMISKATNLIDNDDNAERDVFLKNLETGEIMVVSTDVDGNLGNGNQGSAGCISPDGRYVVISSDSDNLTSEPDTNSRSDAFIRPNSLYTISGQSGDKFEGVEYELTISNVDMFGDSHDDYSGPVVFTSSDGSAVLPVDDQLNWENGSKTFSFTPNMVSTSTTITVTVANTELVSNSVAVNVVLDITAPEIVLSNAPANSTTETSANITVGGSDVTHYKYKLDSGNYGSEIASTSNIVLSGLSVGLHTVYVIGRDIVGNWQSSSTPTSYTWTITAPVVPGSGGGGGGSYTPPSDTTAPSAPKEFAATPGDKTIALSGDNPSDSDFEGVTLLRTNYLLNANNRALDAIAAGTVV